MEAGMAVAFGLVCVEDDPRRALVDSRQRRCGNCTNNEKVDEKHVAIEGTPAGSGLSSS
jgi:hypothetical protein